MLKKHFIIFCYGDDESVRRRTVLTEQHSDCQKRLFIEVSKRKRPHICSSTSTEKIRGVIKIFRICFGYNLCIVGTGAMCVSNS